MKGHSGGSHSRSSHRDDKQVPLMPAKSSGWGWSSVQRQVKKRLHNRKVRHQPIPNFNDDHER